MQELRSEISELIKGPNNTVVDNSVLLSYHYKYTKSINLLRKHC